MVDRPDEAVHSVSKRRRWRLLPENRFLGWTPYAWLVYLPIFLMDPIAKTVSGTAPWWTWPLTLSALVIFLVSYFRGHWLRGRGLLRVVILQTVLGMLFAPINTGSSVFFVYAGSFAASLPRLRDAVRTLLIITALGAITSFLTDAPLYFWISSVFVTLLIGGVNVHFAQVAQTQTRLRLAQGQIEHLAAVAERERIARDLHDVLGHTLTLIVLKAELASKLAERDPARAAREIRDVETVSRNALQEVREAIRGYRASLQDEIERARALLETAGIEARFTAPRLELPRAFDEALGLALREAVTNVARHSNAESCTLTLREDRNGVMLSLFDDGGGAIGTEGGGLRGMRERVELLGGTMERAGTRLTITLPPPRPPARADAATARLA